MFVQTLLGKAKPWHDAFRFVRACGGGPAVEEGGVLLRPDDARVPQRVYDCVVHYAVRLAPLALHRLERLQF